MSCQSEAESATHISSCHPHSLAIDICQRRLLPHGPHIFPLVISQVDPIILFGNKQGTHFCCALILSFQSSYANSLYNKLQIFPRTEKYTSEKRRCVACHTFRVPNRTQTRCVARSTAAQYVRRVLKSSATTSVGTCARMRNTPNFLNTGSARGAQITSATMLEKTTGIPFVNPANNRSVRSRQRLPSNHACSSKMKFWMSHS